MQNHLMRWLDIGRTAITRRLFNQLPREWQVVIHNARILAIGYGQLATARAFQAVNANGEPIPWYTYPAIEYLTAFDLTGRKVFEYGSGQSSTFWARRAAEVVSVEHDPAWYQQVKAHIPPNVRLFLQVDPKEYVALIATFNKLFDIIVIDGRFRTQCAKIAPQFLTEQGFLVMDNTDWYPRTAEALRKEGFFQIDFNGFGPINNYTWTTSIFLRAPTGLQVGFRSAVPNGGILNDGDSTD